jgi:hypothetical protein
VADRDARSTWTAEQSRQASRRDPYGLLSRLFHIVARRGIDPLSRPSV